MVVTENDNDEIRLERLKFRQFSTHRTRPKHRHNISPFHNMMPKVANAPPYGPYIPMSRSTVTGFQGRAFPNYQIRQSHRRMGATVSKNQQKQLSKFECILNFIRLFIFILYIPFLNAIFYKFETV